MAGFFESILPTLQAIHERTVASRDETCYDVLNVGEKPRMYMVLLVHEER